MVVFKCDFGVYFGDGVIVVMNKDYVVEVGCSFSFGESCEVRFKWIIVCGSYWVVDVLNYVGWIGVWVDC